MTLETAQNKFSCLSAQVAIEGLDSKHELKVWMAKKPRHLGMAAEEAMTFLLYSGPVSLILSSAYGS